MIEANKPVFPIQDMNMHPGPMGLTKREYFAAMAMQGMLSALIDKNPTGKNGVGIWDAFAHDAVCAANVLIAVLSVKEGDADGR